MKTYELKAAVELDAAMVIRADSLDEAKEIFMSMVEGRDSHSVMSCNMQRAQAYFSMAQQIEGIMR